jgi:protease-4
VANELTMTGSIGVIMHSYNWRGLMDKIGVRPQTYKSGALKDMFSPDRREEEITSEERRILQNMIDETFERFKTVVEEGRGIAHASNRASGEDDEGRPLSEDWQDYADGRVLSGKEAFKHGFVDELGNFETAVKRTQKLAGIRNARLVRYLRPMPFSSLFRLFGQSEESRVKIDLGFELPRLRSGLYFLTPSLAQ